jgi:hypothetical protein
VVARLARRALDEQIPGAAELHGRPELGQETRV